MGGHARAAGLSHTRSGFGAERCHAVQLGGAHRRMAYTVVCTGQSRFVQVRGGVQPFPAVCIGPRRILGRFSLDLQGHPLHRRDKSALSRALQIQKFIQKTIVSMLRNVNAPATVVAAIFVRDRRILDCFLTTEEFAISL